MAATIRNGSESEPRTKRGRATRQRLVEAAHTVFADKQYLDTNVADIVREAGVAHGTFYRYFTSKEEIFRQVALELQQAMMGAESPRDDDSLTVVGEGPALELLARIERGNRRYLQAYQRNARLMGVLEQVATFNSELLAIRREVRLGFIDRTRRSIERMQAEGLAVGDIDAHYAANALGAMVDRFAYVWLVLGESFSLDEACRTLTLLWARSLGLEIPVGALGEPGRRPRRAGSH